jgi:diaminopimelate decarboxylase
MLAINTESNLHLHSEIVSVDQRRKVVKAMSPVFVEVPKQEDLQWITSAGRVGLTYRGDALRASPAPDATTRVAQPVLRITPGADCPVLRWFKVCLEREKREQTQMCLSLCPHLERWTSWL